MTEDREKYGAKPPTRRMAGKGISYAGTGVDVVVVAVRRDGEPDLWETWMLAHDRPLVGKLVGTTVLGREFAEHGQRAVAAETDRVATLTGLSGMALIRHMVPKGHARQVGLPAGESRSLTRRYEDPAEPDRGEVVSAADEASRTEGGTLE